MMMSDRKFNETDVELATLEWLQELGYETLFGPEIAPGEPGAERDDYQQVFLESRFRDALARLNPKIPADSLDEAFRRVIRTDTPSLIENNRQFHRLLVDGVDVEYQADDRTVHDKVWLVDFDNPENNDWLAVNQYTVIDQSLSGKEHNRRPDVVLLVNGLPLVVIELKNAADENATTRKAFDQLQNVQDATPVADDVQRLSSGQRWDYCQCWHSHCRLGPVHAVADN